MAKHRGESSKMGQAGTLPQVTAGGLQVQTRSQTAGATHEERGSEHDEREVGYLLSTSGGSTIWYANWEKEPQGETFNGGIDVLEASLE
ncbi:hypothetical protein BHE74_00038415 [Ensete ventricosum]|nr:hypothetical protein BHE74_00038415 [Ensete ventricosum]